MKTSLVILAAGIGSRFGGGIKQITPVGPGGEIIIDYSIRDALEAGFNKVVFIIRKDIEKDFKEAIGNKVEKLCDVEYVYQSVSDLPIMTEETKGRVKPWGTTHALWCARKAVHEPFLVINADDYYGKSAYKTAHDFLVSLGSGNASADAGIISFVLKNTLSENGGVTRGICKVNEKGFLSDVEETYNIMKDDRGAYTLNGNGERRDIDADSPVSMNMWCFTPPIFEAAEHALVLFLMSLGDSGAKKEHVLPTLVKTLIEREEISVKVLSSDDTWVGVTYKEDTPMVVEYFRKLISDGVYPERLY